jgi:GrpB-like predicted nucleotidyltransferase (UPF0157 family)
MNLRLEQMTAEELGQLFPIIISDPDPDWIIFFHSEKAKIETKLGKNNIVRIEHIGSTAIPGLKAKPTIDILLEVPDNIDKNEIIDKLTSFNYHYIPRPENPAPHMMFVKGYTSDGFKGQTYHIHVRYHGDWDELYFRDYLKLNPTIAKEYVELKIRLANEYRNDRDAYTDKKTDFVKHVMKIARRDK